MSFREYDPERDLAAVRRIWFEIGWLESENEAAYLEDFLNAGRALVADIDGEAESLAHAVSGTMLYQSTELKLSAVTAVATSRIARRFGFARRLTAALLASEAELGGEVAALGMFEQGFYERLGFGTGAYEQWVSFDPATLLVDRPFRVPKRFGNGDWRALHAALSGRLRGHGGCNLEPVVILRAELGWTENGFGLGYEDGLDGALSHFIWMSAKGENGPYTVKAIAYRNADEFLELLALLHSLADQVSSVCMLEPGGIQLQDLLKQPLRNRRNTEKSTFESSSRSLAPWQLRILDLGACLSKTRLHATSVEFNLKLSDPVAAYLPEGSAWAGIGGDYVVRLGSESSAVAGADPSLATLQASAGAFSRMWFGIQPASGLAITDELSGPAELLEALDRTLVLPKAHLGWDF